MQRGLRDVLAAWSPAPLLFTSSSSAADARRDGQEQDQVPLMAAPFALSKSELSELAEDGHAPDISDVRHPAHVPTSTSSSSLPAAGSVFSGSQLSWLALYFVSNLSLTLYNKFVLVRFPFPYTLTALHALCGTVGGYVLMERGVFEPHALSLAESAVLAAFSVLYTVNIAVSNLSLGLVTVPVGASPTICALIRCSVLTCCVPIVPSGRACCDSHIRNGDLLRLPLDALHPAQDRLPPPRHRRRRLRVRPSLLLIMHAS